MSTLLIDDNIQNHINQYGLNNISDQLSSIIVKYGQFHDEITMIRKSSCSDDSIDSITLYCVGLISNQEKYLRLRELEDSVNILVKDQEGLIKIYNMYIDESDKIFGRKQV